MNAIRDASEYGFNHARFHELEPGVPDAARYGGWTPDSQKRLHTAFTEWQAHLDAGRLTPQKPTPPHIRATHEHNHRALGLRFPGK